MTSSKRAFTMIELLVVVGMLAVLMAAMGTSVSMARERARTEKARAEVKIVAQAIYAYENWNSDHELPVRTRQDCDKSSIGFLLGSGESAANGDKIPALLMAALRSDGKMVDPWGTPYKVTIKQSSMSLKASAAASDLKTGYYLPNWYRIGKEER